MKNKKLLMLVLAAMSVSAVGAVAATGCDPEEAGKENHKHSYTWQSNAEGHWEECECGDTQSAADHVDAVNNETQANGKDGKCDVCDYAIKQIVTFDMLDHGEAPAVQPVDFGAKATRPAQDPEADGYNFIDWYKDADCTIAFNFDDPINDNTTIYAKWEENTTPGESSKYAFDLELATANPKPLGSKGKTYYKFTSATSGRYKISLNIGLSQNCRFTTDEDDGVYYGKDCDASEKYFDILPTKDSIVIILSCAETLEEGAEVSVVVNEVTNEPLPADAWLDGLYTNGSTSFILDRSKGTMAISSNPYSYSYIGGSFDTMTVVQEIMLGTTPYKQTYTFKHTEDGTYKFYTNPNQKKNLVYIPNPEEPIAVSKFEGKYTPIDGNTGDNISEIVIGEDGLGHYVISGNTNKITYLNYDTQYNFLVYDQYLITLNLDNAGNAESINVFSSNFDKAITYERTGNAIPSSLPLGTEDCEYAGDQLSLRVSYGQQYWGNYESMEITDYVKAEKLYTVKASGQTYKLKFEGTEGNLVIKVYDETGEHLLDSLTKYEVVYHDLPTTPAAETTVDSSEFKKSFYHYQVQEGTAGWYTFSTTDENLEFYVNLNSWAPADPNSGTKVNLIDGSATVYLSKDVIVGVRSLYTAANKPATITFTFGTDSVPDGRSEDKPTVMEGNTVTVEDMDNVAAYYYEYTVPATGKYLASCYTVSNDVKSYSIHYTIDGVDYGYQYTGSWSGDWVGGISENSPYASLDLTAGQTLKISVDRLNQYTASVPMTFMIFDDYRDTATDLTLPTGTASASLTSGIYKADLSSVANATGIKITGTADFTVTCEGVSQTISEITLTAEQLAMGFKLDGSATYVLTYTAGTQYNPYEYKTAGTHYATYVAGTDVYVKVTAPEDADFVLSMGYTKSKSYGGSDTYYYFTYNGVNYGYDYVDGKFVPFENVSLKIAKGTSITVTLHCAMSGSLISYPVNVFLDLSAGATTPEFTSSDKEGTLVHTATATVNGSSNFYFATTNGEDITLTAGAAFSVTAVNGTTTEATLENDVYTCTVSAAEELYFKVTSATSQTVTFTQTFAKGSKLNPYEVTFENGSSSLSIKGSSTTYVKLPAGTYTASTNSSYGSFILNGNKITGIFTVADGDVLEYSDSRGSQYKLTFKNAVAEEYQGNYILDDSTKVSIGGTTLTMGDVVYSITSVSGNTYTYSDAEGANTLTVVFDTTITVNGDALTVPGMFTPEQATTYNGTGKYYSGTYTLTLTLNTDGSAVYTVVDDANSNEQTFNVNVENVDGKYTFGYTYEGSDKTVTFYFNEDNAIVVIDTNFENTNFGISVDTPKPPATTSTYKGRITGDMNWDATLTLNADCTQATLSVYDITNDASETIASNVPVTKNGDTYSFSDSYDDVATFTISGDTITFSIDYYGSGTLTKEA